MATSYVFHKSISWVKLSCASLIGAASSTLLLSVAWWISVFTLPLSLFLVCKTAFDKRWISASVIFLSFGIFFAGFLTAIEGVIRKRFSSPLSILPILLLAAVGISVFSLFQKRLRRAVETLSVGAVVRVGENKTRLVLLVDSGNLIREKRSGLRVIIIGERASERLAFPKETKSYEISLKSATGTSVKKAFLPDSTLLEGEYEEETFLILPEKSCRDFAGYDGIIPIPNTLRRKK